MLWRHSGVNKWNGLRRSPLKRSTTPLKRSPMKQTRKPIPQQSAKRKAIAPQRAEFVRALLTSHPSCQAALSGVCTGRSTEVHESIRRSAGGAIVPGEKATTQGQTFWALCHECHEVCTNPDWMMIQILLNKGLIQSRFRG